MSRPDQIVLVSDLHLGAGDDRDPFRRDCDFVAFCDHLAATRLPAAGARRLAVLGDFLELLGVRAGTEPRLASSAPVAVARLDRIARAHPVVFAAMADLVATGWDLDVVVGNHDIELLRPDVRRRLSALLHRGAPGSGRLRFHSWIIHVPGLLYAEHGHQYHDINWFPELAWAAGRRGDQAVRHPLAAQLGGSGPALAASLVRDAGARLLGGRDPRRRRYRREGLAAVAAELDVGADALRRIDRLPATSTVATARRMASVAARRRQAHSPYLRRAAAAIDGILRADGAGCAVYAFGHSHVAECMPLGATAGALYVNPGTWCRDVRGPLRHAGHEERATYAVIDCPERSAPVVSLRAWHQREEVVVAENP